MRAAGQEEEGHSNKILSSVFHPSVIARYVKKQVELYQVRCLANENMNGAWTCPLRVLCHNRRVQHCKYLTLEDSLR